MNIGTGTLVLLLRANNPAMKKYVGLVRAVGAPSEFHAGCWRLSPPVFGGNGSEGSWSARDMLPIRDPGDDAVDEMTLIAGKPTEVTA